MFSPVGIVEIATEGKSEDEFMERALVNGVEDIEYDEDVASIYTQPGALAEARDALRAQGIRVTDAYLGMRPTTKVELAGSDLSSALSFLEALEEHEDVQRVFTNLDFTNVPVEA
jgi:transcriptional/translational regulatory protein YebC/TACO1